MSPLASNQRASLASAAVALPLCCHCRCHNFLEVRVALPPPCCDDFLHTSQLLPSSALNPEPKPLGSDLEQVQAMLALLHTPHLLLRSGCPSCPCCCCFFHLSSPLCR